jgi:hypothetical protein
MSGAAHVLESVPGLAVLVSRQQGTVSRRQLRELGVDAGDVAHQVAARRWQLVSPLVVATFTGSLPRASTIWAAAVHGQPGSLIDAWTALEVHGTVRWERRQLHLAHPRGRRVLPMAGVVLHESRRLDPAADADPRLGLPVVRPARAAVDAASWSDHPDHAAGLIAAVVQQGVADTEALRAELEAAGSVRFRRAIAAAIADADAGAESVGEIRIGPILTAAGLPEPRRQTPRYLDGRVRFIDVEVDLADGSVLVVEVDGLDHDAPDRRADDTLRDLDNLVQGRVSVRVTSWALRHRRRELVARFTAVRRAAQRRAAAGGSARPA